jgi:AcrR family transcriptional regulator
VRAPPSPQELLLVDATARRFTQERARRTYEALVGAAGEAFLAAGYDATGTPDIAARAGVSVGTFYRYFEDKKQAYLEVTRRFLAEAYHRVMDRLTPQHFTGMDWQATIAETVEILLEQSTRHPTMHKTFVEMSLRDPDVLELRRAFDKITHERLSALIAAVCSRQVVPDPEATALVMQVAAVECASVIGGIRGPLPVEPARAKAALTAMLCRTLFGDGLPGGD